MKISRIHRLLKLITLLQTGEPSMADDLAPAIKVSRRTVFRDLHLLKLAGVPVAYDAATQRHTIEQSFFLPPVNLTLPEALGLMVLLKKYAARSHLLDLEAVAAAITKIESTLPRHVQTYCGSALDSVECRHTPASTTVGGNEIFHQLWEAAQKHQVLNMRYESYYEGREISTKLHPYRLVFIARAWYVIGYSQMHEAMRTFKLDRVIRIDPAGEDFQPDPGFNTQEYFQNAWCMIRGDDRYDVRIRFSPKVAGNVEEVLWHPTQQICHLDDGSIFYDVCVDGVSEIAWWVLGYGKEAVVERPPELRQIIAEHVAAMTQVYQGS